MTDFPITSRAPRLGVPRHVFAHQITAALTTGTEKWEWIVPFSCKILDVICDSATAGSGGTSDIIDVNLNGTTIYTTQGNRPTLLAADTGMFTEAGEPEVTGLVAGDIISLDVDQVASTGSARFKIAIVVGPS